MLTAVASSLCSDLTAAHEPDDCTACLCVCLCKSELNGCVNDGFDP